MEVMQVLHMNKGDDENSYAKNSKVQVCIPFSFYLFLYLTICARIHEVLIFTWFGTISRGLSMARSCFFSFFSLEDHKSAVNMCYPRGSYNCLILQSKIISLGKRINEEAIMQILCSNIPDIMGIADLGCSSGPNSLSVISEITDIIYAKCRELGRPTPELKVFLNDLPHNDFNFIFGSLPAFYDKLKKEKGSEFGPCFVSATPGSFYGRLFPSRSLHCVHSSSSLHWLSQVCMTDIYTISS